jgi:endonuclease YncB( thermonuclease family)
VAAVIGIRLPFPVREYLQGAAMNVIIKGSFVIARSGFGPYQPDGDTIRFIADDQRLISHLEKRGEAADAPAAAVRFEAIDALEKDQEPLGARAARDRMFALLGFRNFQLGDDGFTVVSASPGDRRGYLIANSLDKYGRVLAFVFPGDIARPDGAVIDPTVDDIRASVNWQLMAEGLVYATFYSTLAVNLRDAMAPVARAVRTDRIGLWARAVGTPTRPARIRSLAELRQSVLFPTLHRRLDDFVPTAPNLDGFVDWIRADPEARNKVVNVLATSRFTDFAGILRVEGSQIRVTLNPEDFVFVDGPTTGGPPGDGDTPAGEVAPGTVVIVGVLVNPHGTERGAEAVTLLNTAAVPVDLAGWSLKDNAGVERLAGRIGAGASLRVVLDQLELGNRGDRLVLVDAGGRIIDKVSWSSPAAEGRTLVFAWPRADLAPLA